MISPRSTKRKPGPWDADWDKAQAKFARLVKLALGQMEKDVWKKIKKESGGRKAVSDVPEDEAFWKGQRSTFLTRLGGSSEKLLLEGVTQAEKLGLSVNFDLVNKQVLKYARTFENKWWSRLESSTREGLRRAIAVNIETGAPLSALRKSIIPLFGTERAEMIASTEVTRLFSEGNRIAYRDAGVTKLEWRTVGDERVCEECEAKDGKRYSIGDQGPPLHVRCRCWDAPVVAGKPLTTPGG